MNVKISRWKIHMVTVACIITGCASQQERAERRALQQHAVQTAIDQRQLRIDITSMNTLRYGTKTVTPDFFLELRGDTLNSYLPYMGRAYQAPLSSPAQGLNFTQRVESLNVSTPKAHLTCFDIDVRTKEDLYHYRIEVYDTGSALVRVRSANRDPVSFDGRVDVNQ